MDVSQAFFSRESDFLSMGSLSCAASSNGRSVFLTILVTCTSTLGQESHSLESSGSKTNLFLKFFDIRILFSGSFHSSYTNSLRVSFKGNTLWRFAFNPPNSSSSLDWGTTTSSISNVCLMAFNKSSNSSIGKRCLDSADFIKSWGFKESSVSIIEQEGVSESLPASDGDDPSSNLGFLHGGALDVAAAIDETTFSSMNPLSSSRKDDFSSRMKLSIHTLQIGFLYESGIEWLHMLHFLVLVLSDFSGLSGLLALSPFSSLPFPLDPRSFS
ncbi:hypothetical protein GDO81_002330 [Engystomops pustulosus]|uniref:Uncharacterized protein n=1 Tax=Engystomops pustulosus TaxID=76066 RepID=A0AAV7DJB8_ENGPU|nr:hypothetical protein GDO81_002330 [Engystomops pustulosus]